MAYKQKKNNSVLPVVITILIILLVAVGLYVWLVPRDNSGSSTNTQSNNYSNNMSAGNGNASNANPHNTQTQTVTSPQNMTLPSNVHIVATFKEGDLIQMRQDIATSPDGSPITYTYSKPLDANGRWQTQIGDAGVYPITIAADDGRLKTIRTIGIEVTAVNRPPVITSFSDVTVNEGQTITLTPIVSDYEHDPINLSYTGWMTNDTYTTTYDDAGTHAVTLWATDGLHTVNKTITVTVINVNRAPVLDPLAPVSVEEGQTVTAKPVFYDPDKGQALMVSYTKPLSSDGTWTTQIGDAGKYDVTVSVTDGNLTTSQPFQITVTQKNLPPTISNFTNVSVDENTTLVLSPKVSDPNGDSVTLVYSGWMNSSSRYVAFGDAGNHSVTLTASDGKLSTAQTITVTVNKVYRAPVFVDDSNLFVQ